MTYFLIFSYLAIVISLWKEGEGLVVIPFLYKDALNSLCRPNGFV